MLQRQLLSDPIDLLNHLAMCSKTDKANVCLTCPSNRPCAAWLQWQELCHAKQTTTYRSANVQNNALHCMYQLTHAAHSLPIGTNGSTQFPACSAQCTLWLELHTLFAWSTHKPNLDMRGVVCVARDAATRSVPANPSVPVLALCCAMHGMHSPVLDAQSAPLLW